jgi:hypothetical protein
LSASVGKAKRLASHADCVQTIIAAHDQGLMGTTILALHRPVSGWMTIKDDFEG